MAPVAPGAASGVQVAVAWTAAWTASTEGTGLAMEPAMVLAVEEPMVGLMGFNLADLYGGATDSVASHLARFLVLVGDVIACRRSSKRESL